MTAFWKSFESEGLAKPYEEVKASSRILVANQLLQQSTRTNNTIVPKETIVAVVVVVQENDGS
jgi:hypothetical protein